LFRYTLSHNGTDYVLPTDPKGWDSAELGITRSPKYHGINYSQILALSFICGSGKEFIDGIYNTLGVDEEILITVEESCECVETLVSNSYSADYSADYEKGGSSTDCDFELLFEGVLDLVNINILEEETQVPLIEQGANQKLNSRADTKVELFSTTTIEGIEIDDISEPYDLNLHSKVLVATCELKGLDNITDTLQFDPGTDTLYYTLPVYIEQQEDLSSPVQPSFPYLRKISTRNTLEQFYTNTTGQSQLVRVSIDIDGYLQVNSHNQSSITSQFFTSLQLRNGADFISASTTFLIAAHLEEYEPSPQNIDITSTYEDTITVLAGHSLFLTFVVANIWTNTSDPVFPYDVTNVFNSLSIRLYNENEAEASVSKAQYIYEVLSRIGEAILDVADPVRSSYYGRIGATPHEEEENGCGSFAAITSGVMIRQYPITGDRANGIQISLTEAFDSLDSMDNIGLGFEKWGNEFKLRWERKDFFYQDVEIIHFEHVPKIKRSVAQDFAYNDVTIGFNKWQTTNTNGLDEYCSKSQYTNGMKSIANPLEKISTILASAYILEEIRRMPYSESATTDTDYDNDNFIIALNRTVGYGGEPTMLDVAEKNENFSVVDNVLSPTTTYNLRYTNSKNLLRNISSISPIITKYPGRSVKFTYGEGNKFISTQDDVDCPSYFNGNLLSNNQDIIWDESGENPLFVAEYLEFQYPITREQYLLLKDAFQNPNSDVHNGYITISNETEIFKGFLIDLKYKQKTGLSTFKLIRKYD